MIPLYGFLQGDSVGLLVLAAADDTAAELAAKLQSAASVRVAPFADPLVLWRGEPLPDGRTVEDLGIGALDRIDVVPAQGRPNGERDL